MNIKKKTDQLIQSKSTIAVFFILFILSGILFADRNFLSFASVQNLVKKGASDGGFLALGMTFVILSVLALGGVLMAMFGNDNMLLGIGLGLLAGAACGFLNGFMVAKMKISSWIATLAMMLAVRGMIMLMTSKKPIPITNPAISLLGDSRPFGIHILIIVLAVLTLACMFVSRRTKLGMALYAVGGNEEASRMMGLKVDTVKIAAFTICGLFCIPVRHAAGLQAVYRPAHGRGRMGDNCHCHVRAGRGEAVRRRGQVQRYIFRHPHHFHHQHHI